MAPPPPQSVFVTCEHASNMVPAEYDRLFTAHQELLRTHRGYDLGTLDLADALGASLQAPVFSGSVTRLLVDLNRSPHNRRSLFSPMSRLLPPAERQQVLARYYLPYRRQVEEAIKAAIRRQGLAFHISVHSFTPELNGKVRQADLGLLYDPKRMKDKEFSRVLKRNLRKHGEERYRVRSNYPYTGTMDGFMPFLRKAYGPDQYRGV